METVNRAIAEFWHKARFQFAPRALGERAKTNVSGSRGAAPAGDPTVTGGVRYGGRTSGTL
jgi:hypothetical protein